MQRTTGWLVSGTLAIGALVATGGSVGAAATTYTVTRFNDPAPDACSPDDCSLREAVIAANANPGADTIRLNAGTYKLTITGGGDASKGDLDIVDDVTIRKFGPGAEAVIDAGLAHHRGFEITAARLTLIGIGVAHGDPPIPGSGVALGGGIRVYSTGGLTMIGGSITDNFARGTGQGGGGAIGNEGDVLLQGVRLEGNETEFAFGGAIYQAAIGKTIVEDSVIRGNDAGFGGGIYSEGLVKVRRSLLEDNGATDIGGAIFARGCGSLEVLDSTITGNRAFDGAGIRVRNASAGVGWSTITRNVAKEVAGGLLIRDDEGDGCPTNMIIRSSILAGNSDNGGPGHTQVNRDCLDQNLSGATSTLIQSTGYNVVGDGTGCGIDPQTGDQIGTYPSPLAPGLAALRFNGGRIRGLMTHALQGSSLALDAGDPATDCSRTDQRGVPRCSDGHPDAGAYERVTCGAVLVNRVGTAGKDLPRGTMSPTKGADGVLGLGGNDRLKGSDGRDGLCGGDGSDVLDGGTGLDRCSGGPGSDRAVGCERRSSIP